MLTEWMDRVHYLLERFRHWCRIIRDNQIRGRPGERCHVLKPSCSGSGVCSAGLDFGWFHLWDLAVSVMLFRV